MSKGSKRRPQQISDAEMQKRWELAFGKKSNAQISSEMPDPKLVEKYEKELAERGLWGKK